MRFEVLDGGSRIRVWAPAKINLFFEVLGKRSDGYHEIETLVAPISLYDCLDFSFDHEIAPGITLEVYDSQGRPDKSLPVDDSNLIAKAYHAFFSEFAKKPSQHEEFHVFVKVFKKIPTKAGLGGGSSDASATLLVLNTVSGQIFSKSKLQELAGQIGSDVPLFLEDGASIGRGRGELVEPFALPELWTVVVKPSAGLSTPAVYRQHASSSHSDRRYLDVALDAIRNYDGDDFAKNVANYVSNRLEESAEALWKGVERWKSVLSSLPEVLAAQMTGSGTAFFALFPNESAALRALESLQELILRDSSGDLTIEDVFVAKTLTA